MSDSAPSVYIHFTETHKNRVLFEWIPRRKTGDLWLLEFHDENSPRPESGEVFVYYDDDERFVKRHGVIRTPGAPVGDEPIQRVDEAMMVIELKGEEMSAESREHYRVCTAANNLFIEFDDQKSCRLLDMSAMGFAVMSRRQREIGDVVPVTLSTGKGRYHGESTVQSVREMKPKQWRLGVHCVESRTNHSRLLSELAQLSIAVQRDQLRRRAGATPSRSQSRSLRAVSPAK